MQMFFIRIRDELFKNGEYLLTPALSFRESHLQKELELEKVDKLAREQQEDEEKKKQNGGDEEKKNMQVEIVAIIGSEVYPCLSNFLTFIDRYISWKSHYAKDVIF